MLAMTEREARHPHSGKVQLDDAYLGGEHVGSKVERGSEHKVIFSSLSPSLRQATLCASSAARCLVKLKAIADRASK